MISICKQKSDLRNSILTARDALPETTRVEMSLTAAEHGITAPVFDEAKFLPGTVVAGFHPIRSEIDPRPFMFELSRLGARLCLPVVTDKTTIEFRELLRGEPLVESGFGTVGPDGNAQVFDPTILIVPLSVYDKYGGRIGYGAGFYDRAIARLIEKGVEPILLGMAFSMQEAETVPMEPHDRHLDGMITETGFHPTIR